MNHDVPVQSLIDHIKTATDVDPWAKEMAEELLKKQEPVKPIRMHHSEHKQTDNYRCGKCGDDIYFEQRFCEYCGQAVKWK